MIQRCTSSLFLAVGISGLLFVTGIPKSFAGTMSQPGSSAMPSATVGGPLAKQLQGKPVLAEIYASWCPGCKNIAPTLSSLQQAYQGKVNFVTLDVSDQSTTRKSEAMANRLGLGNFFASNKSQTSTVAIIDPATGMILKQFQNNPNKAEYKAVLDSAIGKMHSMSSMHQ